MGLTVRPKTVLRKAVPIDVAGQTMLDRSARADFWLQPDKLALLKAFGPVPRRVFTTGHDNLPRQTPFGLVHTYGADYGVVNTNPDFTTKLVGNPWNTTYDWATNGGNVAEIIGLATHGQLYRALGEKTSYVFMDTQRGYSEGIPNPDGSGTYDWYRDPFAKNIDGTDIDPAVLATMKAVDFKKLENRRFLYNLVVVEGIDPDHLVINLDGEYWRGWGNQGFPFPWPLPDDSQNNKFRWLAQMQRPFLEDIRAYAASMGWTKIRFVTGFLESLEGGTPVPIPASTIVRNYAHFLSMIRVNGDLSDMMGCSQHLRCTWTNADPNISYLDQDELLLAWFTPTGKGTLKEIRAYFRSICAAEGRPNMELVPFANSIDPQENGPMPEQWQVGHMAFQYQAELIKAGYVMAMGFNGFWGNNGNTGAGNQGLTGAWTDRTDPNNPIFHPFEVQPQYYSLKMMNEVLAKTPDQIEVVSDETRLPTLGLAWKDDDGTFMTSLFLQNKRSTQRTLDPVAFPAIDTIAVKKVLRYSQTETTAPEVDPSVITLNGKSLTAVLPAYSITRIDLAVTPQQRYELERGVVDTVFTEFGMPASYEKRLSDAPELFDEPIEVQVIPTTRDRELGGFSATSLKVGEQIFELRVSEAAEPKRGDRLTVDGAVYRIQDDPVRRDRLGLVWTIGLRPDRTN